MILPSYVDTVLKHVLRIIKRSNTMLLTNWCQYFDTNLSSTAALKVLCKFSFNNIAALADVVFFFIVIVNISNIIYSVL